MKNYLTTLALTLIAGLTFWFSPVAHSPDSRWVLPTAVSLLTEGDIGLNEYRAVIKARGTYGLRRKKGEYVNFFPVGPALIATPFVWGIRRYPEQAEALFGVRIDGSGESLLQHRRVVEQKIAAVIGAATVGLTFLMLLPIVSLWPAIVVTVCVGWGSSVWSVGTRGLWQHGPALLFLTAALCLCVRLPHLGERARGRWGWGMLLGALLAGAYLMRPTSAVAIIALGAYLGWVDRRWLGPVFFGALPFAAAFVGQSISWYDHILPPYYRGDGLQLSWTTLEALMANLVSPSRGVFVMSAWSLASLWTLRRGASALVVCLWGWCGLHLLAVSCFDRWWAGHSYGPRFMSEIVPPLAVLAALAWRDRLRSWPVRGGFLLLVGLAIGAHAPGALSYATVVWNRYPRNIDDYPQRIWSLTRPQSLAPWYLTTPTPRLRSGDHSPVETTPGVGTGSTPSDSIRLPKSSAP